MCNNNIIKTYFLVDSVSCNSIQYDKDNNKIYEFTLPIEFYTAKNDKYIEVRYCYALFDGYMLSDAVLHSDFIKRDNYLDSTVSVINVLNNGAKPDKYLIPEGSSKYFKVWFTNLENVKINPNCFQLKLLLIYKS